MRCYTTINLWTAMDKSGHPPMKPCLKCPLPAKKCETLPTLSKSLLTTSIKSLTTTEQNKRKNEIIFRTGLLSANSVLRCENIIARRNNQRIWKKMDAAKFLDEAKRGLWNDPTVPSFQILKRSYDSQAFHFRDEKN